MTGNVGEELPGPVERRQSTRAGLASTVSQPSRHGPSSLRNCSRGLLDLSAGGCPNKDSHRESLEGSIGSRKKVECRRASACQCLRSALCIACVASKNAAFDCHQVGRSSWRKLPSSQSGAFHTSRYRVTAASCQDLVLRMRRALAQHAKAGHPCCRFMRSNVNSMEMSRNRWRRRFSVD